MSKVSLIVPVCNAEKYLKQCLDSLIHQTLYDIEIICVDDCSSDSSVNILKEYENLDNRINLILYDKNKSAAQARKDGVFAAKGEYVLFVDSDDFLELNACKELYYEMQKLKVDILHFGTKIENCLNISEGRISSNEKLLRPYTNKLRGKEVFTSCFLDNKYGFTLWNKIYTAKLCKKAFLYMPDGIFPKAQDLYAYFMLSFFADSYIGISDRIYYHYCFGRGITGHERINLQILERYCTQVLVADGIKEFLQQQNCFQIYEGIYNKYKKKLLNECITNWQMRLPKEKSFEGFDILIKHWGEYDIITALAEKKWYQREEVAKNIYASIKLKSTKTNIKTIATYYHHIENGGVQRVLSLIIPIWISMGYQVILFTDTHPSGNDYQLPDEVNRVVLQSYNTTNRDNFNIRANQWHQAIEQYQIDVVVYHAWLSPVLFWDMCYIKSQGIPFIVNTHSIFSATLLSFQYQFGQLPSIYSMCDAVVSLSSVDKLYWSHFASNSFYIPNPIDDNLKKEECSSLENHNILWIGRFSAEKRPMDAIRIMELVIKEVSDAKLYMVGSNPDPSVMIKYKKETEKRGLENNIIFCGFHRDVSKFYKLSSINILLSRYEGFPMTLLESKAYGVPTVMYEMPYIEMARDNKGIIFVPQSDIKNAAYQIIKLLNNDEDRKKIGYEARSSLQKYFNYDYYAAWKNVFSTVQCNLNLEKDPLVTTEKIMMNTLIDHYKSCWKQRENMLKSQQVSILEKEITSSWSFRIGRAITWLPRKIRGGFRCYKENGVKYTLLRIREKIVRRQII
ncbi:Glycosyltransferase involved in cell wall bisynthesis [Desulfotomaculum arcticum]|uniref:Glycosyltransferase involved in cell wall bisynthesis n=1 Tax=Desulfotruncus arcticus DSM 17038 TaxID=1121424 RepID=A0A1I2X2B4_9FIRM|nr:glycosyltransferase [Desulfotruncus arcticus]SFH06836.1 Glycosyltransferase involved in cell wall bisynthesis [Desulfotomaculum arcticum] [Desulfotruncus arcticus DSM 17038]